METSQLVVEESKTQEICNNIKETRWIDAWIRWERDSKDLVDGQSDDDDDDEDDDDGAPTPPTDIFSFRYTGTKSQPIIDIDLKGFPSDSEQTWNSTGLTVWRSSEHLCDFLVSEWRKGSISNLFAENQRFLELGSGLGRGGILALHCLSLTDSSNDNGDKLLCLTDGDTDVLHQLRENLVSNRPNNFEDGSSDVTVTCSQLLWGRERALEFLEKFENKPFDVLFGSDLVYVAKVIQPLFETVATLLSECSCFVMAHCTRRQGNEVSLDMVLEAADSFGLEHTIVDHDDDISVLVFRWKN